MGSEKWYVVCEDCGMTGPEEDAPLEAIYTWNKYLPRQYLQLVKEDTKPY